MTCDTCNSTGKLYCLETKAYETCPICDGKVSEVRLNTHYLQDRLDGVGIDPRPLYYVLVDGEPVPESDTKKWGEWLESHLAERIVKKDRIGDVEVSTVFLALDHAFDVGPPLIYETMIFGGERDGEMHRYSTKEEALRGHEECCREYLPRQA